MKRSDFRFFHRLRVRWAEVDMQKIVFNAHYLMYFDTAITEYWRALALPMEEVFARLGGELYVKKATVEFNASAQMDDLIDVALRCERIGNSSIQFIGAIFHGDKHLISSEIIYVFADPISQTSRPVPEALRNAFMALEAGEPMVEMKVGTWAELGQDAGQVRNEVFVEEDRLPLADLPAGGITVGQCASLNQAIVEAIDADGFLGEQGYALEFSSPGLDRPLVTAKDFRRNLDRAVRFWLKEPVEGKTEHTGVLMAADEKQIVVRTKKKEIVLPLGQIVKAMLII